MSSHLRILGTAGETILNTIFYARDDRDIIFRGHGASGDISFEQANQIIEYFHHLAVCPRTDTDPAATGRHGLVDI